MKGRMYQLFLNRFNKTSVSVGVAFVFFFFGILCILCSRVLGNIINIALALFFIIIGLGLGVFSIVDIRDRMTQSSFKKRWNPYAAVLFAFLLLGAGIAVLAMMAAGKSALLNRFYIAVVGIFVLLSGVMDIILGAEIVKVNKSAYYYLVNGVLSVAVTLIVMAVLIHWLGSETPQGKAPIPVPSVLFILIGIKFCLIGGSVLILGAQAKRGFSLYEDADLDTVLSAAGGSVQSGMSDDNVEEAVFEEVDRSQP